MPAISIDTNLFSLTSVYLILWFPALTLIFIQCLDCQSPFDSCGNLIKNDFEVINSIKDYMNDCQSFEKEHYHRTQCSPVEKLSLPFYFHGN